MSDLGEKWAEEKILTMNGKVYTVRFEEDFLRVPSVVKQEVDLLNELHVSDVYHCDGLVLCVAKDKKEEPKLVLWNPYLSQTRFIEPRENNFNLIKDRYAIGYDDSDSRNHKILRFVDEYTVRPERKHEVVFEIYDIRSNSWRVLDAVENPEWSIERDERGVSVKGNTYFYANHLIETGRVISGCNVTEFHVFLLCFDFAKDKFGPRLPLPFDSSFDGFNGDVVTLSSFNDDEQLAVLFGGYESGFFEIWVTRNVDPKGASWSKILRMEPGPFCGYGFQLQAASGSFFVDEKNNVAVLFELYLNRTQNYHKAFVFIRGSYFKSFTLGEAEAITLEQRCPITNEFYKTVPPPLVTSYRPSLVQVEQPSLVHKRKRLSLSAAQRSSVKLSKRMSPPPAQ